MTKSKLILAAALSSISAAELLRGKPDADFSSKQASLIDSTPPAARQLPSKKDLQKLKRLNIERKRLNSRKKQQQSDDKRKDESAGGKAEGSSDEKSDKQNFINEKKDWKNLSKEEKKALLEELKSEEESLKEEVGRDHMSKKDWKELLGQQDIKGNTNLVEDGGRDKSKDDPEKRPNLISQFSTLLDKDIDSNKLNSIWKSLTKEEKKQLLDIQDGKLIIKGNKVIENPDYSVDKLSKYEKKEQAKLEKEDKDEPSSEPVIKPKPKPNDEGKPDLKPNSSAANSFVKPEKGEPEIESQPDVGTTTTSTTTATTSMTTTTKRPTPTTTTTTAKPKEKEEDMSPNSEQVNKPNNEANNFVIPMPSLTHFSSTTTTTTATATTTSSTKYDTVGSSKCNDCFEFATEILDPSVPFETNDSKWTMNGLPWSTFTDGCYNSDSCVASGITGGLSVGEPAYSNLTLTTDKEFDGGILTFYLKDNGLQMPNEAFSVSVDGKVASSILSEQNEWVEYGVVVGRGQRVVTWTHVYNPLGLDALPDEHPGSVIVDDLRYSPFQRGSGQDFEDDDGKGLVMTSDGDAAWEIDNKAANSGSYSIVAKTKNIKNDSGSSNLNFALYSQYGGTLKYKITTSTTAPHDDFAVLLNGKPYQAVFGVTRTAPAFEYKELDIPSGKVTVTLQHRKNPGSLSRSVLESMGKVETTGQTRLDDIKFDPHRP